jgi:hypothetical protein
MKLEFLNRFSKNTHIWNFIKIRSVGAELFHADGQIGMVKIIVAFRNFAKEPKNFDVLFKCVLHIIFALHFWMVFIFVLQLPRVFPFPCLMSELNVDQTHLMRLLPKWMYLFLNMTFA